MRLDREAAARAVRRVADPLGLSLEEAAAGIVQVNSFAAATLIRQRTIEQGLDPRDFVLYAFGGAGPVHAFAFARELGVAEVVIPLGNGASTLSAYGIAASDVVRTFEQECRVHAPFDPAELAKVIAEVEESALDALEAAGFARGTVVLQRTALMRYAEQFLQELPLDLPSGEIDSAACAGPARSLRRRVRAPLRRGRARRLPGGRGVHAPRDGARAARLCRPPGGRERGAAIARSTGASAAATSSGPTNARGWRPRSTTAPRLPRGRRLQGRRSSSCRIPRCRSRAGRRCGATRSAISSSRGLNRRRP